MFALCINCTKCLVKSDVRIVKNNSFHFGLRGGSDLPTPPHPHTRTTNKNCISMQNLLGFSLLDLVQMELLKLNLETLRQRITKKATPSISSLMLKEQTIRTCSPFNTLNFNYKSLAI